MNIGTTVNDVPPSYGPVMGYVVATDSFLSGWGKAENGSSYYAVAVRSHEERESAWERMNKRSDFRRVRFNLEPPRVRAHDHLHIVPFERFRYGLAGFE